MNETFWQDRRVFVTGHTGFKGTWLCLWLQHLGAKVTGYALAPETDPNLFDLASAGQDMESILGDVRDGGTLATALRDASPEIVVHMAAQALVRASYVKPVETFDTNIMGTVNLLEAVRDVSSVRAVVVVTSDKCYENREWVWGYREDEPLGGFDPYSSSKGCAELVTAAYRRSFFDCRKTGSCVAVASARSGNVIGGGDWSTDRIVPDVIRALTTNQPAIVRNPHAIRPWQHVLEPLSGYLLLAEHLFESGASYAESWNFGPHTQDALPVCDLVDKLVRLWGEGANWALRPDSESQPHEATYLKLDSQKLWPA